MPPVLVCVVCFAPSDIQGQIRGSVLLLYARSNNGLAVIGGQSFTFVKFFTTLSGSPSGRHTQIQYKLVYRSLQILSPF
jgi:hypothetical protein